MNIALRAAVRRAGEKANVTKTNINRASAVTMSTEVEKVVEETITKKLTQRFQPAHLDVINESYMHSVPKGSETHFKVVVVSNEFKDLPLIKRHRLVNETLSDELKTGVHALAIVAKTPDQWETSPSIDKSPACRGGAGL